jgi:predicted alpha/beta hydrolase family esterase
MRNAIILHGLPGKEEYYSDKYPSASNSHWLPWLQNQLLIHDIKADTPEMFKAYEPHYDEFVREVEKLGITPQTTLVGHSLGGGFWVQYLSEHPEVFVDKVVLVAPWINNEKNYDIDFFDFEIDPTIVERVNEFIVFTSDNDDDENKSSEKVILETLPNINHREFHGYGHFTLRGMGTTEFPELLEAIL